MSQLIEATVDQAGVIRIPKEILEELEFEPGNKLFFELSENGEIKLRKADSPAELVIKDGIKVIRGIPSHEIQDALERDREERLATLMNGLE
jgi:AbrB family looped-hinge helix DNA binding protein